jgi:hypothetical protein
MAMETSPTWLLDWDNMLQPNRLQTSSETSNRSPHDHSDSRASNSQDHTSIPPSNLGTTMENSSYATIDSLDFESLLDLTQINSLGLLQDDAMDIEAQGYGTAHQTNYDIDPEIRGENFPPRHVNPPVKIPEPHLEIVDLKEEVLRRLADLHSGLLTNLNLMRNVGKCPCKHTARVSLASSQRNADGKTEEYNFLVGRMLNKSEEFISILQNFTPPVPSHSGSGLRGSGSESDPSDSDQGIMNAFTSSHKRSTPNGSDLAYFESPDSITNPSRPTLRCDVPMTLSILTCYVCLIRIYRTIFSSIYTALTIAKERKMDLPPLFPGLKLGGFAPHMNFQVQILVQISTNLLNKIDEALGLPDEHGQTKNGSGVLHQTGSAGLLQTMMKEEALEGLENGDPTKESPREIFRKLSLLC